MSQSFYTNFYRVLSVSKLHPREAETEKLVPWILWRLWKSRNEYLYKGHDYNALEMVRKALDDAEEWANRKEEEESRRESHPVTAARSNWCPPPLNWLKCNVDAAWTNNNEQSGIGWVLRDHHGRVIWMGGRKVRRMRSVLETEAEALRWAALCMTRFNYKHIIFESDSKVVVDAISEDNPWPVLNAIHQDLNNLLNRLDNYRIVFNSREANGVADRIANEAFSFLNNVPKLYSLMPNWIMPFVEYDTPVV